MEPAGEDAAVLIGRVVKAHGIRGEVVVHPLSDVPGRFDVGTEVVVGDTPRVITSSRAHQGRLLLALEGVDDRNAAERLRGDEILGRGVDLEDSETYFAHELVGMAVRHVDGRGLGAVSALIELPEAAGYDLLEVTRDGTTWLLPAAEEFVEVVEEDGALLLVVDPPEGLLDDEPEVAWPDGPAAPGPA
ncbi:MAG: ribosome maturation factor RimM [Nitriliruptoraceae bacterium]